MEEQGSKNGGGAVVVLATQDKIEVVMEIWKRVRNTETMAAWICTEFPTCLKIARIRDKFEADGAVHDGQKQRSGKPWRATSAAFSAVMLELFTRSPQKSAKQYALETAGISVLKHAKRKIYVPSSLHGITENDPGRRIKFCEWFQHKVHEEQNGLVWWSNIWAQWYSESQ
jgi:hypothetical protein